MKNPINQKNQKSQNDSTTISGAEAVIRCLLAEDANLIYGYPGGAIMPVYDELYKYRDQLPVSYTHLTLPTTAYV